MQQNETTPCWACGGPTAPTSAYAPFEYLACARCGLAFRPFQPTAEVHAEYTSGRYAERYDELFMGADQLPQRRRESRRRLEFAGDGLTGRRLFDVGAGGGIFVAVAREAGWDADGVEPDPGFVEHARRVSGVELRQGTLEDLALDPHSIDLATLWHVLEHLVDPADELRRLRGWLADGGRLAIEVPNAASAPARVLGPQWGHADLTVHVSQFTPTALGALLERSGYRVLRLVGVPMGRYYSLRQRVSPGNLASVAKWRWREGGQNELLLALATPA